METLRVEIPVQALSINQAFQGRRFKTRIYQAFEREATILLPRMKMMMGLVEVWYEFGLTKRNFKRSDVGNLEKCLSDILVKRGYIEDDRKIMALHLQKVESSRYYVSIEIRQWNKK